MAGSRIKGLTIEIDGNTTKLTESLKDVDKSLKDTQSQLKDVNKLLKLDPSNVDLLKQKQELLKKAVEDTKKRQEELKTALEQSKKSGDTAENRQQQDLLQRELIETTQKLEGLEKEYKNCSPHLEAISSKTGEMAEKTKGVSMAAGAAGAAMLLMAGSAASTADDLLTLSRNTGFSVEELQKLQYAAPFVDVSFESMTGSITKLTKKMGEGSDAFDKLGICIHNSDGTMRDAKDVWYEAVAALGEVQDETERDTLAMELFGKSAMEMSGIVDDGGAALKELGEEAESTGNIMSSDAVAGAAKFNDELDKVKQRASLAFAQAGASLAQNLLPALEKLVEVISDVLTWFGNLDGTTQTVILTILGLVAAISPVLSLVSTLTGLAAALNVAMLPMIGTIAAVIAIVAAVIAIGVLLYKNWDKIKEKAKELAKNIKEKFEQIKKAISEKIEAAKKKVHDTFEAIKTGISEKIAAAKEAVTTTFENIKTAISDKISAAKTTVSTIFENIRSTIKDKIDAAKTAVSTAVENIKSTIKSKIESAKSTVTTVFETIRSKIKEKIDAAKEAVSGAIEKIKGFFNFSWSLPKLKMPHVTITGSFSLTPPSVPKFSIDWYKKAMDGGMILRGPTIFGASGNKLLAGGEAGPEVVVGVSSLAQMINNAVAKSVPASQNNYGDTNVYIYAQPGMDAERIAQMAADRVNEQIRRRREVFA